MAKLSGIKKVIAYLDAGNTLDITLPGQRGIRRPTKFRSGEITTEKKGQWYRTTHPNFETGGYVWLHKVQIDAIAATLPGEG